MCLIRGAELLAGVAARTEPNARNWLGELSPRTKKGGRQVPQYNWGLMNKEARIPEWHSGQ